MNTFAKIAVALGVTFGIAPAAHAGGFLADIFIKPLFGDHAAREADKVHEQLGKPLDKAAEAAKAAALAAAAASKN
jgi:hypothetical protein